MKNPITEQKKVIRNQIYTALEKAAEAKDLPVCQDFPEFIVEIPADSVHGDFSANIAMVSARTFSMPPRKIAEILQKHIDLKQTYFEKLEVAGPGFLNFYMSKRWFAYVIETILDEGKNYGKSNLGNQQAVMVEFISANPTGPMHIGNARGGAIGNSIAGIFEWLGYKVTREFYVNDAGNQIEKFAQSLNIRYLQHYLGESAVPMPEDAYHGDDITILAEDFISQHQDALLSLSEEERKKKLTAFALPKNMEAIKRGIKKYRICYDVWFHESTLHQEGWVEKTFNLLKKSGYTYQKEGAVWFATTKFGCEKDDVLVRANGFPTYFLTDIAYHYHKFNIRGFEKVINVWGADHHGHVQRLKAALTALGIDKDRLVVILIQMVRLFRGGEHVKLSKRSGKAYTLEDLLNEVSVDAVAFFFNMREPNTHFDFDLDLALRENADNPVYYVQYAYARICSLIKRLESEGCVVKDRQNLSEGLTDPAEFSVIRHLAKMPDQIIEAAQQYDPARITHYVLELAALFHKFYNQCRVRGNMEEVTQARLKLCIAVKTVLYNVLSLLNIQAPEQM